MSPYPFFKYKINFTILIATFFLIVRHHSTPLP